MREHLKSYHPFLSSSHNANATYQLSICFQQAWPASEIKLLSSPNPFIPPPLHAVISHTNQTPPLMQISLN